MFFVYDNIHDIRSHHYTLHFSLFFFEFMMYISSMYAVWSSSSYIYLINLCCLIMTYLSHHCMLSDHHHLSISSMLYHHHLTISSMLYHHHLSILSMYAVSASPILICILSYWSDLLYGEHHFSIFSLYQHIWDQLQQWPTELSSTAATAITIKMLVISTTTTTTTIIHPHHHLRRPHQEY